MRYVAGLIGAVTFAGITAGIWGMSGATAAGRMQKSVAGVERPNVVFILTDDVGYGDISSNGATRVKTPNIDRIAADGIRFTNAYAPAATCTPSRYALMTGEYAFRKPGTGVLPGDAAMIIDPGRMSLPKRFKDAGYATAAIGKWHLGLGSGNSPLDWNKHISPGANAIGFDETYLIPATVDRVPTVWVKNGDVISLDPSDPIQVDYKQKIGSWPTGRDNPELLKQKHSHGHDMTIVNGIGRIGWMTGGKKALWVDEDIADTIIRETTSYIEQHKRKPFFLYIGTHDIHVPRVPHKRFAGKSGMGPRGDAILQLDAQVGAILKALDKNGLSDNTMVVFTSDNGPVVDDGYEDQAVALLGDHKPAGPLRGGKYSLFEGGTRVPFLVRWPAGQRVTSGDVRKATSGRVSDSMISLVDMLTTFDHILGPHRSSSIIGDGLDVSDALRGTGPSKRNYIVEHAGRLALRWEKWKLIPAGKGAAFQPLTGTETGNLLADQLYDLDADPHEDRNVAAANPDVITRMKEMLAQLRDGKLR
ncbi:MAG: sulfatase-like hydrolase/transferase [Armatimonadota bacterium]